MEYLLVVVLFILYGGGHWYYVRSSKAKELREKNEPYMKTVSPPPLPPSNVKPIEEVFEKLKPFVWDENSNTQVNHINQLAYFVKYYQVDLEQIGKNSYFVSYVDADNKTKLIVTIQDLDPNGNTTIQSIAPSEYNFKKHVRQLERSTIIQMLIHRRTTQGLKLRDNIRQ